MPWTPGYEDWLNSKMPAREAGTKHCAVRGCKRILEEGAKANQHHCYCVSCKKPIHLLCCMENGLCDDDNELNMYCSLTCKNIGKYDN